jgi:hypothetical protein
MVKPEYRFLFYTAETAVQHGRKKFAGAESTEEMKMQIFTYHAETWSAYEGEVRELTTANWARWKEEQPAWFTEEVIQRVPDDFIPVAELAQLNAAARGGRRRRSSVGLEALRRGSA